MWQRGKAITYYNASGHIREVDDQRGSRRIEYINNASGQILSRRESIGSVSQPQKVNYYYYASGIGVGEVGNTGNSRKTRLCGQHRRHGHPLHLQRPGRPHCCG